MKKTLVALLGITVVLIIALSSYENDLTGQMTPQQSCELKGADYPPGKWRCFCAKDSNDCRIEFDECSAAGRLDGTCEFTAFEIELTCGHGTCTRRGRQLN